MFSQMSYASAETDTPYYHSTLPAPTRPYGHTIDLSMRRSFPRPPPPPLYKYLAARRELFAGAFFLLFGGRVDVLEFIDPVVIGPLRPDLFSVRLLGLAPLFLRRRVGA